MKRNHKSDLGLLFIANAAIHMRTYLLPTILIALSEDFSLTLFQLGGLISLSLFVESISFPISGYISDRGNRSLSIPVSILICGIFLAIIGIIGQQSLYLFLLSLTLIGAAAGFYHTAAISLILDLFDEKTRGKAQSIHGTGSRIGTTTGPILAGLIFLTNRSWTDIYLILSIPVFLAAILLFMKRVGKDVEQSPSDIKPVEHNIHYSLKPVTTVLLGSLIILTIIRTIGAIQNEMISFIIPIFLTEQGYSQANAAFLFSWMAVSGTAGVLLGGYATDKIGPQKFLMFAYLFQGVTAAALIVTSGTNLIFLSIFLFGAATSTTFPAILSLVAKYTPMYRRGMAYAMTSILPSVSRSFAPTVDGYLVETRSTIHILILGMVLAISNVLFIPILKRHDRNTRESP